MLLSGERYWKARLETGVKDWAEAVLLKESKIAELKLSYTIKDFNAESEKVKKTWQSQSKMHV